MVEDLLVVDSSVPVEADTVEVDKRADDEALELIRQGLAITEPLMARAVTAMKTLEKIIANGRH